MASEADDQSSASEVLTGTLVPVAMEESFRTRWDPATKRTILVILVVASALLFWLSRPVLTVLILAGIISYLLNPIVDACERLKIPRSLSTLVLYLMLLVLLIITPILLVPVLLNQLSSLYFDVPSTTLSFIRFLQRTVAELPTELPILGFSFNIEGAVSQIQAAFTGDQAVLLLPSTAQFFDYLNRLISTATNLLGSTAIIGVTVVGGIFNIFLFLIFLFVLSLYMTKDAPKIRAYIEGLFPEPYHHEGVELVRAVGRIWQSFFRGQLILSLVIGFTMYGVLNLMGMRGALILAIVAGAFEVMPNIGPILAAIPAVIVALIQGSTALEISNLNFALLTIGVYFVVQQLENQLLVPRIIGTSVNLHPVVVLSGVVVGASVGGVLGAFLAAPVIASLRVVGSYLRAKLLDEELPFAADRMTVRSPRRIIYRRVVRPEPEEAPEEESKAGSATPPGKLGSSTVP